MKLSKKEKLAEGSYSIVYKCKDRKTESYYAVKRLMISKSTSFCGSIREIDIVMAVQHPFVVKCHGLVQDTVFRRPLSPMSKSYKDDGFMQIYDLYKNCLRGNEIKIKQPILFAFKILLGIEFIHGRGIVHRDIKPENILIDDEENPRIGDFGLAQRIQNSGDDVYQTLNYRSPELLFGWSSQLYDCRSTDIWAYGCILYELFNAGNTVFGKYYQKDEDLITRMSQFVDLTLVKERGVKTYPITPRVFPIDFDIVRYIMNPDPNQRPTARNIIDHPFFDIVKTSPLLIQIRSDNPVFPVTMDTIDINTASKTRIACCNILINISNKQRVNSWFRYNIIFHTLEVVDRIISSGKQIKVKKTISLVISILYILLKVFNEDQTVDPPSFETFAGSMIKIDEEYSLSEVDFNKLEYHLLHDILDYHVFRMTPYEYHKDQTKKLEFKTPPGWSELQLLFMMYTRMPTGRYHISDIWRRAREVGKRLISNSSDIIQTIDEVNRESKI